MPELPEVETIRRIVESELIGRILTAVDLTLPKLVRDSPIPQLDALLGHRLERAERRAKVLVTHWSDGLSLLTHFKLAGQLAVIRPDDPLSVRDAAIITTLWSTGVRRGELVRMEVQHLDLEHGTILIPLTKTGRPRRVALTPHAAYHMTTWLTRRLTWKPSTDHIWLSHD